jgi:hypothetical protein
LVVVVGYSRQVKDRSGAARLTARDGHSGTAWRFQLDGTVRALQPSAGRSHQLAAAAGLWTRAVRRERHRGHRRLRHPRSPDAGHSDDHHRDDAEDKADHALAASARAWCSHIRHDGPLMLNTTSRCIRRSWTPSATAASRAHSPALAIPCWSWPESAGRSRSGP